MHIIIRKFFQLKGKDIVEIKIFIKYLDKLIISWHSLVYVIPATYWFVNYYLLPESFKIPSWLMTIFLFMALVLANYWLFYDHQKEVDTLKLELDRKPMIDVIFNDKDNALDWPVPGACTYWRRIKIINRGNAVASECVCKIFRAWNNTGTIMKFDPIQLHWVNMPKGTLLNIAPYDEPLVDFLCIFLVQPLSVCLNAPPPQEESHGGCIRISREPQGYVDLEFAVLSPSLALPNKHWLRAHWEQNARGFEFNIEEIPEKT